MRIDLACGTTIGLRALDQWLTYGGLLEGLPTSEMNERLVRSDVQDASDRWASPVHLIEPQETRMEMSGRYPFGAPASIPGITCVSHWSGPGCSRGDEYGRTDLTLVWYQPDFALPIDEEILSEITALDWEAHARFTVL
jgi:hypothetical protein